MFKIVLLFLLFQYESGGIQIGEAPYTFIRETEYTLGPGDSLEVLIKDLGTSYIAMVDLNGKIALTLPLPDLTTTSLQSTQSSMLGVRSVLDFKKAAGLTIAQLKDSLQIWYSKYYKGKEFDVRLLKPRQFDIFLYGRINNPGPVRSFSTARLVDILISSGKCSYDADISRIKVFSVSGDVYNVNLRKFYMEGDYSQNPLVATIRKIFIPPVQSGVVVVGAVKGYPVISFATREVQALSGNFILTFEANVLKIEVKDSLKVSEIISQAGGLKSYSIIEDIYSAKKGKVTLDTYIMPDDTLYIPPFTDKVFVAGEVKNPQPVPYLPGASISTYISYCGGYTDRASRKPIVYRANKKLKNPLEIKPGDIIYVEPVILKWWQDYAQILQIATTLAVTWLTLTK
ncbi:MAG TPA: hypothetical protein ENL43_02600 [candidate division WOR-3 bacterium]|uniref:Soluble ligand binding domain-containing protein n=1 Tax=candidate division WOR-3 bacterium TaxID=2052148 RepID=A0A7V5HN11_UNCW3|nr:hypothetical protein [candidate division WOR-3 bacterium]